MAVGLHTANLANKWLDTLSNTSYASGSATLFVKLHTADPGATAANAPSSVTTRMSASWNPAGSGSKSISNVPSWTNWAGSSETISHISVWDNVSAGNFLFSVQLTTPKPVTTGDTLNLTSLSVSLAPLAA